MLGNRYVGQVKFRSVDMRIFLLVLCFAFVSGLAAQDVKYAKSLIKLLSSPEFHGRGYVKKGDKKAAVLIRREMNRAGLSSFDGITFFQPFQLAANTFPKKTLLKVDKEKLEVGVDFVPVASSCSCEGKYNVLLVDSTLYKDSASLVRFFRADHSQEVVVMDFEDEKEKHIREIMKGLARSNSFGAKAIVTLKKKTPIFTPSTSVADFCRFEVLKEKWPKGAEEVELKLKNEFLPSYTTNNVIGYLKGRSDSLIVVTAHYDHVGRIGSDAYFPGANDNASGTAMMLDLARHFGKKKALKYTYVFIAFSGEESGLIGSDYFVKNPLFPLENIKVLLNFDMVGSGGEGITVVNGAVHKEDFELMKKLNSEFDLLPEVASRGKAANSDHYPFSARGVKAFFIYTRGDYKEYHNVYDKYDKLPLTEYEDLFRLVVKYIEAQ